MERNEEIDFWRHPWGFLETSLRIFGDFWGTLEKMVRCEKIELPSIGDQPRKWGFEATVASKQARRSDLTSYLKSMAQTTYANMFVLTFFWTLTERKKEEHLSLLDLSASPQVKMFLHSSSSLFISTSPLSQRRRPPSGSGSAPRVAGWADESERARSCS